MTFTSNALLISPLIDTSQWLTAPTITLLTAAQVGQAMRITMPLARNAQRLDWQRYRAPAAAVVDAANPATWGAAVGAAVAYNPATSAPPELAFEDADAANQVVVVISAVGTFGAPLPPLVVTSGTVAARTDPGGWGTLDWDDILVSPDDWDPVLLIRRITLTVESTLPAAGTNLEWIYVRTTELGSGTIAEPTTGWRSFAQTPSADEGDLDLWVAGGGVDRTWGSSGGGAAGQRVAVHIGKRNTLTGDRHYYGYEAITCERPIITDPTDYSGFTQNVNAVGVSADAAWADAVAKAQARITAGTAGDYIIGLPSYNYGARTYNLVAGSDQRIGFQSISKSTVDPHFGGTHIGGAKFTSIDVSGSNGFMLRFADFDRTGLGWIARVIDCGAVQRFTLEYCRLITQKRPATGWPHNAGGGIGAWHAERGVSVDSVNGVRPNDVTIRACAFSGLVNDMIYWNATDNLLIEQNVGEEAGGDFFKSGGTSRWVTRRDNWLPRRFNNFWNQADFNAGRDPWTHCDGQQYAGTGTLQSHIVSGDVMMLEAGLEAKPELPYQGLFTSGAFAAVDWLYEQCFVVTNTVAGASIAGSGGSNNRIQQCAFLRVWDWIMPGSVDNNGDGVPDNGLHGCYITTFNGAVVATGIVECKPGVSASGWTNSTCFNMVRTDPYRPNYTASGAGYESLLTTATFYEARPKLGTAFHWLHANPQGPALKFKRTLVDREGFPKLGPAWPMWKRVYDRRDQIIGAAG